MANGLGSAAGRSKRDQMPKQIRLNAFDMNCVGHQSPGLWTHPRDRSDRYNTLDYWVELAKLLERGKFDALFLADVLGVYDVYRGSPHAAIANAVQVPVNDPLLLIPAMAYVTRNLGFGVTCAVTYEPPYTLARRFSTLDHLTGGGIGWNVVTGYLNSAAKGIGLARQPEHDTRYEIAEEYMQIVYKLWEGSWEDGAVLRDRTQRVFARPENVHRIRHDGRYFQTKRFTSANPRPQRTPLVMTAARGRGHPCTQPFTRREATGNFPRKVGRTRGVQGHRACPCVRHPRGALALECLTSDDGSRPESSHHQNAHAAAATGLGEQGRKRSPHFRR